MTTQKHTPGRLFVNVWSNGRRTIAARVTGDIMEVWPNADNGRQEANAVHAVDCWNACEGIDPGAVPAIVKAARELLTSLRWEEKRSGSTYAGYEDLILALAKAELDIPASPQ